LRVCIDHQYAQVLCSSQIRSYIASERRLADATFVIEETKCPRPLRSLLHIVAIWHVFSTVLLLAALVEEDTTTPKDGASF
jgi:hypothetical protein